MESNTIKCYDIFHMLRHEYICNMSHKSFKNFLDSKDLGVSVVDFANDIYEITDKKKWFLARIKYGI